MFRGRVRRRAGLVRSNLLTTVPAKTGRDVARIRLLRIHLVVLRGTRRERFVTRARVLQK